MNAEYEYWLSYKDLDPEIRKELLSIKGNDEEIESRFAVPMSFGTAGLRSTMKAGISGMNIYTVGQTTKGLANLICERGEQSRGVAVAYDSRNNSYLFAKTAACVLAAAGIKVYFYESLRPTPCLSFAILHHHCIAGINITASHNPKEYNGYKAYWEDGAQMPPEHADAVSRESAKTDIFKDVKKMDFDEGVKSGIIEIIGKETDEAYIQAVLNCRINPELLQKYGDKIGVVYTPVHGTGYKLVPEVLRRAGITSLNITESQSVPDGNFPTVDVPNPENPECFDESIDMILKKGIDCELIIGTDPDADRLGLAVKDENGLFVTLSGNQIGAILIDYIIKSRRETGTLPKNACAVKSIVSSELFTAICKAEGVTPMDVLTGFKYIGGKIAEYEQTHEYTFIFGYEESHGYLSDGYARDKDAVAASLLVAEAAAYYKSKGSNLCKALNDIYARFGRYDEKVLSIKISGNDPMKVMKEKMTSLRKNLFAQIAGVSVMRVRDYLSGIITDLNTAEQLPTGLPKADVLYFELEDGTNFIIRPSGTEPKIKVYILAKASSVEELEEKKKIFADFALSCF